MNTSIEEEVQRLLSEIREDPARFAAYDLDGNGRLDEAEEARLRSFLTAQVRTERALRGEREHAFTADAVERIAEHYVIIRELGAGGQARTYLALDEREEREVVVKQLHLAHLENWKAIELFEREGEVLAQLDHPRIPSYLGAHHEEEGDLARFLLIQEYLEGPTLAELLDSGRRFEEREIKEMMRSLLEILVYLQDKNPPVIHRDLKPSNIIQGLDGSWALIDFGAIQAVLTTASMIGSTIVGTSGYMAPEQFMGRSVPATDLYALGATAVHALSHVHPAQMPLQRMRLDYHGRVNISAPLRDFLDRLLDPNVEDRYEDAREALAALDTLDAPARTAHPPAPNAPNAPVIATATASSSDDAEPNATQPNQQAILIAVTSAAVLIIAVVVMAVLVNEPSGDPPPSSDPPPISFEFMPKAPSDPSPVNTFLAKPSTIQERFDKLEIGLQIKVSELEKLTIDSTEVYGHYNNEASIGIGIKNNSSAQIETLKADVHIYDGSGELIDGKTEDVHQSYQPPLRPGDLTHFDVRMPITEDARKLVVTIISAKKSSSPDTAAGKPFPVKWVGAPPEGVTLIATPRLDKAEVPRYGDPNTIDHDVELAITNKGKKSLSTVKLEKRVYDKKGEMVGSEDSYLNGVYDPSFDPGETLLISLDSDRHPPFERYEIIVIDHKLAE